HPSPHTAGVRREHAEVLAWVVVHHDVGEQPHHHHVAGGAEDVHDGRAHPCRAVPGGRALLQRRRDYPERGGDGGLERLRPAAAGTVAQGGGERAASVVSRTNVIARTNSSRTGAGSRGNSPRKSGSAARSARANRAGNRGSAIRSRSTSSGAVPAVTVTGSAGCCASGSTGSPI